jgi:hypothetical protein
MQTGQTVLEIQRLAQRIFVTLLCVYRDSNRGKGSKVRNQSKQSKQAIKARGLSLFTTVNDARCCQPVGFRRTRNNEDSLVVINN